MHMSVDNYYMYVLMNKHNTVIYIGVTNNLARRISEHKQKLVKGFTSKYNTDKLVYYEHFGNIEYAIRREKELKGWKRIKKIHLIIANNPTFKDLSVEWGWSLSLGDPSLRSG